MSKDHSRGAVGDDVSKDIARMNKRFIEQTNCESAPGAPSAVRVLCRRSRRVAKPWVCRIERKPLVEIDELARLAGIATIELPAVARLQYEELG